MPRTRGGRLVLSIAAGVLAMLGVGGIALRYQIQERWWLWKLDSPDRATRERALLELINLRSDRAGPRICQVILGGPIRGEVWQIPGEGEALAQLPRDQFGQPKMTTVVPFPFQLRGAAARAEYLAPHLVSVFASEEPSWRWVRALRILDGWKADREKAEAVRIGLPRVEA